MQIRRAMRRELPTPSPIPLSNHWKRQEEEANTDLPEEPADEDPVEDDDPANEADNDNDNPNGNGNGNGNADGDGDGNTNNEENNNEDNLQENNGGEDGEAGDGSNDDNLGGENSEEIEDSPTGVETDAATPTATGSTEKTTSEATTTPPSTDESSEEDSLPPSTSEDPTSEEEQAEESNSSEREEDSSAESSISYTSTVYENVSSSSSAPKVSASSDDGVEITDAGPIAGIVVAGVIVLALLIWFLFKCCTAGDGSRDRRLGRRPVTAFKKRTFWDDIPAPHDAEDKQPQQQPTLPSTALPEEAPPAFVGARRSQRSSPSASPSAQPTQHSHQSAQSGGAPVNQRKPGAEIGGNVAEFTQRRPGVARAAAAAAAGQTHHGAVGNTTTGGQRTGYAATESEGQSQWVDVVDEKPLLNPYSNYG